jgi:YHS domain-containing protein
VDYKGRRIYFCCKECPPVFNKDPEKYIKLVDAELKGAAPAKTETK